MDEEKNSQHFDIASLLEEAKTELCLPYAEKETSQEEIDSILDGFSFVCPEEYEFVSLYSALDLKEKRSYPLFFYSVIREYKEARIQDSILYINQMAEGFLSSFKLMIPDFELHDVNKGIHRLNRQIEENNLLNQIRIIPSLNFFSRETFSLNQAYQSLVEISSRAGEKGQFLSLFSPYVDKDTKQEKDSVFNSEQRALDALFSSHGSKVTYDEDRLRNHFLINLLIKQFQKKKSTILFMNEKRYQEVKDFLQNKKLTEYVFEFHSITPLDFQRRETEKADSTDNYSSFLASEDKFSQLRNEKSKEYKMPSLLRNDLVEEEKEDAFYDLEINTKDYTEKNYQKDRIFLNELSSSAYLKGTYILNHPLFGLSAPDDKETYNSIQLLIVNLNSELRNFSHLLKNDETLQKCEWIVDSIDEYQELMKNVQLLRQYNGFPLSYFTVLISSQDIQDLDELKGIYQATSSSRLLILNFCNESIFSKDLSYYVSLGKGNFFQRLKLKRLLKGIVKKNKKTDLSSLMRVFQAYLDAQKKLEEALPAYQKKYGDRVYSMNGVSEIENSLLYVQEFKKRGEEIEGFNLKDPFVSCWLSDSDFRRKMDAFFSRREEEYRILKRDLNAFIGYFPEGKRNYGEESFDDLRTRFQSISLVTYTQYQEYVHLHQAFDASSLVLRLAVRKYESLKRPLLDFSHSFRKSLAFGFYRSAENRFQQKENDFEQSAIAYFSYLSDSSVIETHHLYLSLKKQWQEDAAQIENENERSSLLLQSESITRTQKEKIYQTMFKNHPIILCKKEDIPYFNANQFDTAVLFDSEETSDIDFINAVQSSENILILNRINKNDGRTQNYHEEIITREILYGHRFSFLENDLMKLTEKKIKEAGYEIIKDNPSFPFLVKSKIRKERFYAMIPDCYLSDISLFKIKELNRFLIQDSIILVPFTTIHLFIDSKLETDRLIKILESVFSAKSV